MKVQFNPGSQRLWCVKILKEELNLGLVEARDCVVNGEFECTDEQFKSVKEKLIEHGAEDFTT